MRFLAAIVLVILLATPIGSGGEDARPGVAVTDFAVFGKLSEDRPDLGRALGILLATELEADHEVLDRAAVRRAMEELDLAPEKMRAAEARALAERTGAERVAIGILSQVGGKIVGSILLRDGRTGAVLSDRSGELESLDELPAWIESRSARAAARRDDLERALAEIARLQTALEELHRKTERLKALAGGRGPDLRPEPPPVPRIHAVVTAVSSERNLVTLSAGRLDFVRPGFEFTVYSGDRYVGKVVVDRVEEDHCVGHSRKDLEKRPIAVGDQATTAF
jgi:hypothetical protein